MRLKYSLTLLHTFIKVQASQTCQYVSDRTTNNVQHNIIVYKWRTMVLGVEY